MTTATGAVPSEQHQGDAEPTGSGAPQRAYRSAVKRVVTRLRLEGIKVQIIAGLLVVDPLDFERYLDRIADDAPERARYLQMIEDEAYREGFKAGQAECGCEDARAVSPETVSPMSDAEASDMEAIA